MTVLRFVGMLLSICMSIFSVWAALLGLGLDLGAVAAAVGWVLLGVVVVLAGFLIARKTAGRAMARWVD